MVTSCTWSSSYYPSSIFTSIGLDIISAITQLWLSFSLAMAHRIFFERAEDDSYSWIQDSYHMCLFLVRSLRATYAGYSALSTESKIPHNLKLHNLLRCWHDSSLYYPRGHDDAALFFGGYSPYSRNCSKKTCDLRAKSYSSVNPESLPFRAWRRRYVSATCPRIASG